MPAGKYHEADIDEILSMRDEKQLRKQFEIVDNKFPDGVFTFLEFGCADGHLLIEWVERYPNAIFIGIDLDIESMYEEGWPALVDDHPNLRAMLKGDMLESSYVKESLQRYFHNDSVDVIHGHAAIMYLDDHKTHQFLQAASSYARNIISRDLSMTDARFGVNSQTIESARIIERCLYDVDIHWTETLGRYVRPMTTYDIRDTSFSFQQFSDYERYTHESSPSLTDYMTALGLSVPNLLKSTDENGNEIFHSDYDASKLAHVKQQFLDFGSAGDYLIVHWHITVLENTV